MMDTPKDIAIAALTEAISKLGSQTALAALLSRVDKEIKTGHIYHWLQSGVIPVEHCWLIAEASGVPRERLRPLDYWICWRDLPAPVEPATQEG